MTKCAEFFVVDLVELFFCFLCCFFTDFALRDCSFSFQFFFFFWQLRFFFSCDCGLEMATSQRTRPRAVVGAPRRAAWQLKSALRHSISAAPRTIIFLHFFYNYCW